ncbi:MAG: DUF3052 domain-containing protein [Leptospiraceae bacterium]|nr:DUF3052 domain-containing protein [Leptospiraceae bacterium]
MVGYSGKPLHQKLGLKAGTVLCLKNAPADYEKLLGPGQPENLEITSRISARVGIYHVFEKNRSELERIARRLRDHMAADAALWISWPKKSSGVATDLTEDVLREILLPMGYVDIKVCAVSETWSGLKFVIRKSQR